MVDKALDIESDSAFDAFLSCLDALEELVETAKRVPLTASVMVSEDDLVDLLEKMRDCLPAAIKEGMQLTRQKENLLDEANERAAAVVAEAEETAAQLERDAHERAAALVAEHVVLQEASGQAQALRAESEARAAAITAESEEYAHQVMLNLHEQLEKTLNTVDKGLDRLRHQHKK